MSLRHIRNIALCDYLTRVFVSNQVSHRHIGILLLSTFLRMRLRAAGANDHKEVFRTNSKTFLSTNEGGWHGEKGGEIQMDRPGQHVLERTSVVVTDKYVEARSQMINEGTPHNAFMYL